MLLPPAATPLPPFTSAHLKKDDSMLISDLRLTIQVLDCEDVMDGTQKTGANVAAVLRVSAGEDNSEPTTAWDNFTIVAQGGRWEPVSGELCMLGCRKRADINIENWSFADLNAEHGEQHSCDCRICMIWTFHLSLKQRSTIRGSISSLRAGELRVW